MSHDLRISARTEKSLAKTENKFTIQGGSKLEVFDEDGKLLHEGEFKSFTSNFLKLLYGSMVGAGTAKAKDLSNNNVEMNSLPQAWMNLQGGSGLKKFGVVVGTNTAAVSVSDYAITVPANLTVNDTIVSASTVGADSISVEISRQIGNSSGSTVSLKEAGLICGSEDETNTNVLIARDLLTVVLDPGKKSVWRYTINFNFANDVGGFVKTFADQIFSGIFEETTSSATWSARINFAAVVYDGKMWMMGGVDNSGVFKNDVWYSSDGITWTRATSSAAWSARHSLVAVVYDNKMWIMGGYTSSGRVKDVWYSTDGVTWTQATANAEWSARQGVVALVLDNKMWMMGGLDVGNSNLNDVWYSSDGVTWTQATPSAAWSARCAFAAVVYDDKMWIMGGAISGGRANDVWYSSDGITWTRATASAGWAARSNFTAVVYDNKIWVMGGLSITDVALNDVWASKNLSSEIKPGSSDSAFSATGTVLGALIANGSGSGQLIYGAMPGATTIEPSTSGNKTKFSIAREFTNNSGADITVREAGLFSGSDMLARLILATPVTIANGESEIITVDFETEV